MKQLGIVLLVSFGLASAALGQTPDNSSTNAQTLLHNCSGDNGPFAEGFCMGQIDTISSLNMHISDLQKHWCWPKDATLDMEKEVVKKYIIDHPEKLQELDLRIIEEALQHAYPCHSQHR